MQQNVCTYKVSIVQMRIIANNTNAKAYYYIIIRFSFLMLVSAFNIFVYICVQSTRKLFNSFLRMYRTHNVH